MLRLMLSDERWSTLKSILLEQGIDDNKNLRMTVEGVLYRMRTGVHWRDLPDIFGKWNSIYKRFNAWAKTGQCMKIFESLVREPDLEWEFIDSTDVKAHQHSAGPQCKGDEGVGKSRGGNTSKIHRVVDSFGLPISFVVTGGKVSDHTVAPELVAAVPPAEAVMADKGYDSQDLRDPIAEQGSTAVIPRRKNSTKENPSFDSHLYKVRHLVENMFARIKNFRAVATRYDKLKRHYVGIVAFACSLVWLPM